MGFGRSQYQRKVVKFRFKDAKGDLYELTVMPMGHRCAPELMHTLTATLAGDRNYCTEKHAFFYSGLDVYIDGIRCFFCGLLS